MILKIVLVRGNSTINRKKLFSTLEDRGVKQKDFKRGLNGATKNLARGRYSKLSISSKRTHASTFFKQLF